MIATLLNDIRYAARWLRRSPGFALAAILSFAIGIGINTSLFSVVDAVLFRPLPFDNSDRLVDVFTSGSDGDRYATSSYPDFLDLRSQNVVFEEMIGYSPMIAAVNQNDRTRLTLGEVVTGNYFWMLGIRAAIGRTLLPEDDSPAAERVMMISDRYWRRELLGLEPNLVFLDNQTMEAQVSATLLPARAGAGVVSVLGSIAMALAAIGLYGAISYSVVRRTREIGVRMALGATQSSVLSLVMRQGLKVAIVGIAAGSILAAAATPLLGSVLYRTSPRDPITWLTATAVLLGVSALANLFPARRASRVDPSTAMRLE